MKVIEQAKYIDILVDLKGFKTGIELKQDSNDGESHSIAIDKQGAAELIKILQEWVDENH